jgi:hypothetical protein
MTLLSGISAHAIILACTKIKFNTIRGWLHMLACIYKTGIAYRACALARNALKFEAGS